MVVDVMAAGDDQADVEKTQVPSDVVGDWVRALRQRRGWTAKELAEHCAEAGAPLLTGPSILNIETGRRGADGRRRRDVSVDELLTLAYVLGVSPVSLLFPENGAVLVTRTTRVDDLEALRRWVRGSDPLPGIDTKSYYDEHYAQDVAAPVIDMIMPEMTKHLKRMVAGYQAATEELNARLERIEAKQAGAAASAGEEGKKGE